MIKIYTCPVCKGLQRILVDTETNKPTSHIRCAYNGCKSYRIEMDSTVKRDRALQGLSE